MMSADEAQIDEIVKDKPYSDIIKQLSMKRLDENTEEISAELFILMDRIMTAFGPEDSGITVATGYIDRNGDTTRYH